MKEGLSKVSDSIKSDTELLNALKQAIKEFSGLDVWWRGQAKLNWYLQPGIYRREDTYIAEQELVRIFRRKARARYPNCPEEADVQNWLFLMQHQPPPSNSTKEVRYVSGILEVR